MNTKYLILSLLYIFLISCKEITKNKKKENLIFKNSVTYAKGFSIQNYTQFKKLTIYTSFQGDNTQAKNYYLIPKDKKVPDSLSEKNIIRIPIEKMVVTSTTHIPMLELIGAENTLVGFPNTQYISSKKTRTLIKNKKVQELGEERSINTELLINLQPELVIGFGVSNTGQTYKNIKKSGIKVIMNSDWLEQTPLGKAEWIRFFGALYDKDSLASMRFNKIVADYKKIKKQLLSVKDKPTVISGSLYQDVWHMPAGNSFVAQFLKDAQTNYLWKDSKGTGSLSLSIESVLEKGKNAEFWINPGFYTSKKALIQDSPHYQEFNAFKNNKLFTYSLTKGPTGGVLYFELASTRPDLVLEDLASIFHPEVFPKTEWTFFQALN